MTLIYFRAQGGIPLVIIVVVVELAENKKIERERNEIETRVKREIEGKIDKEREVDGKVKMREPLKTEIRKGKKDRKSHSKHK